MGNVGALLRLSGAPSWAVLRQSRTPSCTRSSPEQLTWRLAHGRAQQTLVLRREVREAGGASLSHTLSCYTERIPLSLSKRTPAMCMAPQHRHFSALPVARCDTGLNPDQVRDFLKGQNSNSPSTSSWLQCGSDGWCPRSCFWPRSRRLRMAGQQDESVWGPMSQKAVIAAQTCYFWTR